MAQSVDTKIVELKFNNDNFADKVDSTLTKLEQLNKDIKEVGLTDALKNLNRNVKDVDMSGITKGVEETTKGFSKMEVFAVTAMANISNSVVNLGKKMMSSLVAPIKQGVLAGGLSRARNIEQATFQFEGQKIGKSKGNEQLSYYKEVMDAVLGTSYSYDVAAKAASQLAASNIGVEKTMRKLADGTKVEAKVLNTDMTHALLGIAGVASMTGSDFDSIAQIFTRVAGQGKVMAMDLNSIAARGLNAAAVLANYLGKSEAEIRDMVSKGKISFQDFANAMDQAFGQHAKDSTLQFQGALDDVNAALARIGADFYGPALTAGRDILNSVTPLVDAIHTKLGGALEKTGLGMETASKKLSQYLDMLSYVVERFPNGYKSMGGWIDEHMNAWTNITDLYKRGDLKKSIDELSTVSASWEKMNGKGIDGWKMLADYLNITEEKVREFVDTGTIGFNDFYKAFHKLWSESDKLMAIGNITDLFNKYVQACIEAEKPTKAFQNNVKTLFSIFNGGMSLAHSFGQIFGGLASIFLTIAQHLAPLGHLFVDVTKELAAFVVQLADSIATSQHFTSIIDSIVAMLVKLFELLKLDKMAAAILTGITKAFDFLAAAIERLQEGLATLVAMVHKVFTLITDKIMQVLTDVNLLREVINNLKKVGLVVALINLVSYITKPAQLFDQLSKSVENVGKSFGGMLQNIGGVFKEIAGLAGKIGEAIDEVTQTLKRMQELIIATAILEIAIAIGVLAGALYLLAKVPWSDLDKSAPAVLSFLSILGGVLAGGKFLTELGETSKIWEKSVNDIKAIGLAMLEFSIAVAIMAGAIKVLSDIDRNQLLYATGAIETLLITLTVIAKMLTTTTTKDTGLKALWSGKKSSTSMTKGLIGLVAMAEAVNIVAKALNSIASIEDPQRMYDALSAIEVLLWSMFGITKLLSGEKAAKMTKGTGSLLAMAIAIKLLTKPVAELATIDPTAMWNAVGAVSALIGVLAIMTQMMSGAEKMVGIGVGIILVAAAVKMLSDVVIAFSALDPEAMVHGILGVVGMIAALATTLNFMDSDGLLSKAISLVLIGYMLKQLQDVVMTFGDNFESAMKGLLGIGAALTVLLFACYAFEAVPTAGILKLFGALMLGAIVVAAFGAAVGVFGVGIGIFGAGLTVMASGIEAISAVMPQFLAFMFGFAVSIGILASVGLPAVAVILALSVAFLLLGAGILLMGSGLEHIASAVALMNEMKGELGEISWKIVNFVKDIGKLKKQANEIGESFQSIADPLKSMKESINALSKQIDKLVETYGKLKNNTSDCIVALADSLTTLSELNQESFTSATDAIKTFITELNGISGETATIGQTASDISASLETLKTAISDISETMSIFQQRVVVFKSIGESLNSIATPIQTLNSLRGNLQGLSDDISAFVTSLKSMKDDAALVSEGATSISASLSQVGTAAETASKSFSGFTGATAGILNQMGQGLTSIATGVADISAHNADLTRSGKVLTNFVSKLQGLAKQSGDIAKGTTSIANAVKKLASAAKTSIDTKSMTSSGKKIAEGFAKGIESGKGTVETKITSMLKSASNKAKSHRSAFYQVGSYLIAGMVSGISSQQSGLESQVQSLESKAERAVKAKAKIKSPSRVWMQIGAYMGEGLAIGIRNSGDKVKTASLGLASVSEDAVASAITAISNAIDDGWNTDPVITPVVDLSNISKSAGIVNSAFGSGVIGLGSGRLASSVNGLQNGGKASLGHALSDLSDKLGNVSETMNSRTMTNYITVDGAEDPQLFADKLVRSMKLNARTI